MKVLGLVGSVRRLGNSEILTKEALMGAEEEGAEVDKLYRYLSGLYSGNSLEDDFTMIRILFRGSTG